MQQCPYLCCAGLLSGKQKVTFCSFHLLGVRKVALVLVLNSDRGMSHEEDKSHSSLNDVNSLFY